jgi:hypothetical protein
MFRSGVRLKTELVGRLRASILPIVSVLIFIAIVAKIYFAAVSVPIERKRSQSESKIRLIQDAVDFEWVQEGKSKRLKIFNPDTLAEVLAGFASETGLNAFEASVQVYTLSIHAFILHGANAPTQFAQSEVDAHRRIAEVYDLKEIQHYKGFGSDYVDYLEDDWGNPYQIFIGPWPEELGPVLFRVYGPGGDELSGIAHPERSNLPNTEDGFSDGQRDMLTVNTETGHHGFLVSGDLDMYIWSYGANDRSDQPIYDPSHEYAPPSIRHYRMHAKEKYLGGGDDINNWDQSRTYRSLYKQ